MTLQSLYNLREDGDLRKIEKGPACAGEVCGLNCAGDSATNRGSPVKPSNDAEHGRKRSQEGEVMANYCLDELRSRPNRSNIMRTFYAWEDVPEHFRAALSPDNRQVPWRHSEFQFVPTLDVAIDPAPYVDLNIKNIVGEFGAELFPVNEHLLKKKYMRDTTFPVCIIL